MSKKEKITGALRNAATGLMFGVKSADEMMTAQGTASDSAAGTGKHEVKHEERLSKALLRGEVTQEVKELRHRTYKTAQESRKYAYLGNGFAVKTGHYKSERLPEVENSENLKVKYVQHNDKLPLPLVEDLTQEGHGKEGKQIVEAERDFVPRFKIEKFLTHLVIKELEPGSSRVRVDLYVSMYPRQFQERYDKAFLSEIDRIKKGHVKSDILDFKTLRFVTKNAYGLLDGVSIRLSNPEYKGTAEFDGHHVLKFDMDIESDDLVAAFFDPVMQAKYDNREPNELELNMDPEYSGETRYCASCGREINAYDAATTADLVGMPLCPDCLSERLKTMKSLSASTGIVDVGEITPNTVEESDAYKRLMRDIENLD